ncbi:hypothetical protein SAMN05444395_101200 [Flavobacterium fryxellicola]|uniref:Uncharacterized protein n=1 Tax=Flavobacterium fryxellicola TaxID=249352 RepID=A0A167XT66_9FLAO|nr:DUF6252 family protein [Flavobacterium fryxellicola]OAB28670.1 hypothetical protein FBFR_08265 [Flavobacterium fryxellicola]SHN50732.1 hypothetical protein SAMN05444395_101200 [Flavobacterium fryxellicola]
MKKYISFLVVLFVVVSCEEDVRFNNPSFQGMKNNVFWRAVQAKATLASDGSLLIEAYTGTEVMSLKMTSTTTQKYPLGTSNSKTAVYVINQGNSEIKYTTGIGIGSGEIILTEYDDLNRTISGTFKFNAKNIDDNSSSDPVLNFHQGVFYKVPVSVLVP